MMNLKEWRHNTFEVDTHNDIHLIMINTKMTLIYFNCVDIYV